MKKISFSVTNSALHIDISLNPAPVFYWRRRFDRRFHLPSPNFTEVPALNSDPGSTSIQL